MKVKIVVEVPDNFEPFTTGCADVCPFGYVDWEECECRCAYNRNDCPMLRAKE